VGGGFLLFLGISIFFSRPPNPNDPTQKVNSAGDYLSTFLLTLSNPMTIISFAAILGGLGSGGGSAFRLGAFLLVLGVFSGSALWWLTLSTVVGTFRARLTDRALLWVNRASGVVIMVFALTILW